MERDADYFQEVKKESTLLSFSKCRTIIISFHTVNKTIRKGSVLCSFDEAAIAMHIIGRCI